jgi:hypothetical protein
MRENGCDGFEFGELENVPGNGVAEALDAAGNGLCVPMTRTEDTRQ